MSIKKGHKHIDLLIKLEGKVLLGFKLGNDFSKAPNYYHRNKIELLLLK